MFIQTVTYSWGFQFNQIPILQTPTDWSGLFLSLNIRSNDMIFKTRGVHSYDDTIAYVVSGILTPRRWSRCKGFRCLMTPYLQVALRANCLTTKLSQHLHCGKWLEIHSVSRAWQHLSHFLWPIWSTNVLLTPMWFQRLLLHLTPVILYIWAIKMMQRCTKVTKKLRTSAESWYIPLLLIPLADETTYLFLLYSIIKDIRNELTLRNPITCVFVMWF